MPEGPEVETKELQETLEELHEEREEREAEEKRSAWTRYIALTTALLAVVAAIGAMRSGALVNEAMIDQIKAADTWNEYQAARLKDHTYTIAANALADAGAALPRRNEQQRDGAAGEGAAKPAARKSTAIQAMKPAERLAYYSAQVERQAAKEEKLSEDAKKLEERAEHHMHLHHGFALSVAYIQVAIALGAVAALTRMKTVWVGSILIGLIGLWFFLQGFAA